MAVANISRTLHQLKLVDSESVTNILDLPNEVLVKIFTMLSQKDILKNVARVCRRFFEVTRTPEVLPIIKFYKEIYDITLENLQNCLKIYPRSLIELEFAHATFFDMKEFHAPTIDGINTIASFIKYMSIGIECWNFGNQESFPMFEKLEFLSLNDNAYEMYGGSRPSMTEVHGFWSYFPNLTHLYFDAKYVLWGIVSFL